MEQRSNPAGGRIDNALPAGQAAQGPQSVEGSVKDTIESILVAFMLAFIFRAFVVEAFVIPTGSMAPTLLGAHMRFRCPDCGYRFEVNFPTSGERDTISVPRSSGDKINYPIYCPNCGYTLPRGNPQDPDGDTHDAPVRYGDRILVLKYLYLFQQPRRWDVVVFKSPVWPAENDYSQNYIKRLIGKPGERIMILDGDVYVGSSDKLDSFRIQTKPARVQEALWRIVYDNDFSPRGLDRNLDATTWQQPWKETGGQHLWALEGAQSAINRRQFTFTGLSGESAINFDAQTEARRNALTDWLAYDVEQQKMTGEANVGDVKLDFFYQRDEGDGPLKLQLSKLSHHFEAQVGRDSATLLMDDKVIVGPASLPGRSGPRHLEFMNVDYRVSLRIDGNEIFATNEQQYQPDIRALLDAFNAGRPSPKPEVKIIAANQRATLSHVTLWRDVYYLNRGNRQQNGSPTSTKLWASPADFPQNLMRLGEDEFFVMGDNSLVSLDARFWDDPIQLPHEELDVQSGRVPGRFMLGKAFFVYWPAGFRPIDAAPALVPNFGDMRFIH